MENSRAKQNGMMWGLWLGLAVTGGVSVYYYPLFVLTMAAVPALWAVMAFRTHPAMLLAAGALVFLFGQLMGYGMLSCLCVLGMAAPAGCFLWYSQKEGMGNFQSVMYVSVLLTFGLFLMFCVPDLLISGDPYASIRAYFTANVALFEGTSFYETAVMATSRIDELMIACFFTFAGLYALINVLLLHAFNRGKKDMPLCQLGPFGTWFASFRYVMVSGGLCLGATLLNAVTDTPLVSTLSLLLYEMWALPLMLTGANVLYALLSRRVPKGRAKLMFGVALGVALLFTSQFAQMALLLLGLVGVIRRRRAGKEQK